MYDPITGRIDYGSNDFNPGGNFQVNTPGGQITGRLMRIGVQAITHLWMNGKQTTIRNQQIGPTDWYDIR